MYGRRSHRNLGRQFESDIVNCVSVAESRRQQKRSVRRNPGPTQIPIEVHDQKRDRNNDVQQRPESQFQIASRASEDAAVGAHHYVQLVLKQADRKQVRLQLVLSNANRFLI